MLEAAEYAWLAFPACCVVGIILTVVFSIVFARLDDENDHDL